MSRGCPPSTSVCIYCLRELAVQAFDREHVLSEAFGNFQQALVLHPYVCKECNTFFGNELEVRFARGAFEGMLRYQKGVRAPRAGQVHLQFLEFAVPPDNDYAGVRLGLVMDGTIGLCFRVLPQAGFYDDGQGQWTHYTIPEIDAGALEVKPEIKKGHRMRVVAPSPPEYDGMVAKLAEHSINYKRDGELGKLEEISNLVQVTLTINTGILRCTAKYVFNYLAYVYGSEFVRGKDFDTVRQFVRFGASSSEPVVVPSFEPILHNDTPTTRQTDGHLLTVSWGASLRDLLGQVSLFNYITYKVWLCRGFSHALWRPIRSGHHYDLSSMSVAPLQGVSRSVMI